MSDPHTEREPGENVPGGEAETATSPIGPGVPAPPSAPAPPPSGLAPGAPAGPPPGPPPVPFGYVYREPWINPNRRAHVALVALVLAAIVFVGGVGIGFVVGAHHRCFNYCGPVYGGWGYGNPVEPRPGGYLTPQILPMPVIPGGPLRSIIPATPTPSATSTS